MNMHYLLNKTIKLNYKRLFLCNFIFMICYILQINYLIFKRSVEIEICDTN